MSTNGASLGGWKWIRLGDHVTKVGSGFTPLGGHKAYRESGIPLIRSQNVHMNRFEREGLAFISSEQDDEMASSRVAPGDVLLNITGASIGRVCVAPPEICPANVNQHVCIIRSDGTFNPDFLAFYFATPDFQKFVFDSHAGATRQALTKAGIENLRVPYIERERQDRIAGGLREQLAEVERARAAVEAQLQAAEALPAAFLRAVFSGSTAQRWPRQPLIECCELLPSKSIALDADTEVQTITSACLTEWGFQTRGIKSARMWADDAKKALTQPGEILIARSNTPELVGRAALFPGSSVPLVASDLTIRLWPRAPISGEFVAAFLSSLFVAGYWRDRAGGASGTMKKITRNQIENLPILCPSFDEQQRIAAKMKAKLCAAWALREQLAQKLAAVEKAPTLLLRNAFSGKI